MTEDDLTCNVRQMKPECTIIEVSAILESAIAVAARSRRSLGLLGSVKPFCSSPRPSTYHDKASQA